MLVSVGAPQRERVLLGLDIAATFLAFEQALDLVFLFKPDKLWGASDVTSRLEQLKALGLKKILILQEDSCEIQLCNVNIQIVAIPAAEYYAQCNATQVINV